jgi:group I intron endonuclease
MQFGLKRQDSGVYMIKNIINGKVYIGSAIHLCDRLSKHFHDLTNNKHHSMHLQNAWNQNKCYFVCGVIEFVENKENLIEIEQKYINKYKSANENFGYNICPIAGSNLGCKQVRGVEERSKKMSGSGNNFYDKKHTSEALHLISESNVQKKLTNENIKEIKFLHNYGVSQRTIAKIFNVGQPHICKIINNIRRTKTYTNAPSST